MTYIDGTPSPNDAARTVEQEQTLAKWQTPNSTYVQAWLGGFCVTPNGTVIRGAPEDDPHAVSLLNVDGEVKQKHVVLKSAEWYAEQLAGDPESATLQALAQDAVPQSDTDALQADFVEPPRSQYAVIL